MVREEVEVSRIVDNSSEWEDDMGKRKFFQWGITESGDYYPTYKTEREIPSGLYEPFYSNRYDSWCLSSIAVNTDELFELPTKETGEIIEDLKSFWNKTEEYKKYGIVHKRGILLYGDPGCGKSAIIQLCMSHLINHMNGVVINIKNEESMTGYIDLVGRFRQIEPDRPIVVIMEDIDSIAAESSYATSQILNILDGVKQIENAVYIATTNYPEKLAERITNRPSRFDRRYYVSPPSAEVREAYIKRKAKNPEMDIEKWVEDTDGLSISHIKELFISVYLLDRSYEESLATLKSMKSLPRGKGESKMGFGNGR